MLFRTQKTSCHLLWRTAFLLILAVGVSDRAPNAQSQPPPPTVVVHARKFAFVPNSITLKKGQTVKLSLISDDVFHGLSVRDLGIRADLKPGHRVDVMVTPAQAGDFSGSCSVFCGSGHRDMEFTIHVVE